MFHCCLFDYKLHTNKQIVTRGNGAFHEFIRLVNTCLRETKSLARRSPHYSCVTHSRVDSDEDLSCIDGGFKLASFTPSLGSLRLVMIAYLHNKCLTRQSFALPFLFFLFFPCVSLANFHRAECRFYWQSTCHLVTLSHDHLTQGNVEYTSCHESSLFTTLFLPLPLCLWEPTIPFTLASSLAASFLDLLTSGFILPRR